MDFSLALALLRQGHSIQRTGWNGKNQTLHLQESDSKMTLPFIYLEFPAGSDSRGRVPWTATQTDLLANDWMVVNQLAKARYMSGGKAKVPVTVRITTGAPGSAAAEG